MANRIQLRRGTAADWTAKNPVLAQGEPGIETDTGKAKYGDGVKTWTALPYAAKGDPGPAGQDGTADDASVAAALEQPLTKAALSGTIGAQVSAGSRELLAASASAAAMRPVDKAKIAGWGSSSLEGLSSTLTGLASRLGASYVNGAKGGERADTILARLGARPALLTFPGNTIPASGATTVTASNLKPNANMRVYAGTINGIPGTLSSTASALTWTRTTAGTATEIPANYPMIPDLGTTHRNSFTIINVAKNDVTGILADTNYIIDATRNAMTYLAGQGVHFLVMGHFTNTDYAVGGTAQRQIMEANAAMASDAGPYYFDLNAYVTGAQIWVDTGITPTSTDLQQQANGIKPSSLSSDNAHLNAAASAAVAKKLLQQAVTLGLFTERPPVGFADTFNRANSNTLGTTEVGGKTWLWQTANGNALIENGAAGYTGVSPQRAASLVDAGFTDGVLSFEIKTLVGQPWTYFRGNSYSKTLALIVNSSGKWDLIARETATTSIAASTVTAATGDKVKVTLAGNSIKVSVNGVEIINATTDLSYGTYYGFGGFAVGEGTRWESIQFEPSSAPVFTPAP